MKKVRLLLVLWVGCVSAADDILLPFCKSFLEGLSFGPESRFVHEYHPYLLKKTQESFKQLEQYLHDQGFTLAHRYTILGYEQYAMPAYFDCLSHKHIDDEVALKTESGWEFTPGNVSGFLTGYLFKDANRANNRIVEHIANDQVELFGNDTAVLQKHAFGEWYDVLVGYQEVIQKCLYANDVSGALRHVINFWHYIYESRHKGVGGYCATQDLLFSLYYVQYLLQSSLKMHKLFVGPDITYPIEVVERQDEDVTRNAQLFVKHIVNNLVPVNEQKTAYIFCSFVDGVGKSTLLGNVCNYVKHGDKVSAYEHVSNTSSQTASLYTLNDRVVIVDLPAQISHYCAKPDGSVYVDLGFCSSITSAEKKTVIGYVAKNHRALVKQADERLAQYAAGQPAIADPGDRVLYAIHTLGNHSVWRPFSFEGKHYAFNTRDIRQVRILVPFDGVHSQGLKIKEPELMLFDKGLSIPMNYEVFLHNLSQQMHEAGVQQVVFVDFASLYPRTSRETVRINYVIQLLKQFYGDDYSFMHSVYRPFAHQHEVYPLFFDYRDAFERTVCLETVLRFVIYDVIMHASGEGLTFLSTDDMQQRLRAHIADLFGNHKLQVDHVLQAVRARIEQEAPLVAHYQLSKFYESVSRFSIERLAHVSTMILQVVNQLHPDEQTRAVFGQLADEIDTFSANRRQVTLRNGVQLEVIRTLNPYEVDQALLELLMPELRKVWYEHIVGTVITELRDSYAHAYVIKKDAQGTWYLLEAKLHRPSPNKLTLLDEVVTFDTAQVSLDYDEEPAYINKVVERMRKRDFAAFKGCAHELFIPTGALTVELDAQRVWDKAKKRTRDMILPKMEHVSAEMLQTIVRALASVHWIVKCPYDDVMVRYGNRDDFIAAVRLLEDLVIPKYMDVPLKERLFDDYTTLMPLVGEFEQKT